jgi:2-polyprenyl-3-methyl-5-hydroxy-6-metoxy-1,4-benzoquinol methylase
MAERISTQDGTFERGYAIHAQRYEFAAGFASGQRVLDVGCGAGYGSALLARRGAAHVTAIDLSETALAEARRVFPRPNLRFVPGNAEQLDRIADLGRDFGLIVNFENIEHLPNPRALLQRVPELLGAGGVFLCSSPNGAISQRGPNGRLLNEYHVHEFTAEEFRALLGEFFGQVVLHGQWRTPEGRMRMEDARRAFEQLCDAYYNPAVRIGRGLKRMLGGRVGPPPCFTGEGDTYAGDHVIEPLADAPFPWPPEYLLAVCRA